MNEHSLTSPHFHFRMLFFVFALIVVLEGYSQPYTASYKVSTVITWGLMIAIIPDCYLGIMRLIKWLINHLKGSEE